MNLFSWLFRKKVLAEASPERMSDFDPEGSPFCTMGPCFARKLFEHEHRSFYFEKTQIDNISQLRGDPLVGVVMGADNMGVVQSGWVFAKDVRPYLDLHFGRAIRRYECDLASLMSHNQSPTGLVIRGEPGFEAALAHFESLVPAAPVPAPSQPSDS